MTENTNHRGAFIYTHIVSDHTAPKLFDKRQQRKGKYNKNGKTKPML